MIFKIITCRMCFLFIFVIVFPSFLSSDVLLNYSFDKGDAETAIDGSGNGADGTIIDGMLTNGIYGKALFFNGESTSIEVPFCDKLAPEEEITLELWLFPVPPHQKNYGGIINNFCGAEMRRISLDNHGEILAQLNNDRNYNFRSAGVKNNQWNHIVYTRGGGKETFYINGKKLKEAALTESISIGRKNIIIGWSYTAPDTYHFSGMMDEIKIHSQILDDVQISKIFTALSSKIVAAPPPPLPEMSAALQNKSFETDKNKPGIPDGWRIWGSAGDNAKVQISSEESKTGSHSVYIKHNRLKAAIGLESEPIKITPGRVYVFSAYILNKQGGPNLYLQYYNHENKRIGVKAEEIKTINSSWSKCIVELTAPEESVYARVMLYMPNIAEAFFDDTEFYEKTAEMLQKEADEKKKKILMVDFLDHGVCAQVSESRGSVLTMDSSGTLLALILPMDMWRGTMRVSLLVVNLHDGRTQHFFLPDKKTVNSASYSMLLSAKNRLYVMPGAWFTEFDVNSRAVLFCKQAVPGETAMCYTETADGIIYAATHPGGYLIKYIPAEKKIESLGRLDTVQKYPGSLAYDDYGFVYAGFGTAESGISAYNSANGEIVQLAPAGERKKGSGQVYRTVSGKVFGLSGPGGNWYELKQGRATPVAKPEQNRVPVLVSGWQGTINNLKGVLSVEKIDVEEKIIEIRNKDGKFSRMTFDYESEGAITTSLALGNDGRLYGSTAHPMHFFMYDPDKNILEDWGGIPKIGGGNICDLKTQGSRIFGAAYMGGYLYDFEMNKPYNNTLGLMPNPRLRAAYGTHIARPRTVLAHPGGDAVLFSGYATYGYTGGGIGVFTISESNSVLLPHEKVMPNQSPITLVSLPDGNIAGGTSIHAPGGGAVKAKEAELFIMNWKTKKNIFRIVPVTGAKEIVSLVSAPPDFICGVSDTGVFFVCDWKRKRIIHSESLGIKTSGRHFTALHQNDVLYVAGSSGVVKINLKTFSQELFISHAMGGISGAVIQNNRLYFISDTRLFSYRIGPPAAAPVTRMEGWSYFRSDPSLSASFFSVKYPSISGMQKNIWNNQMSAALNTGGDRLLCDSELDSETPETANQKTIYKNVVTVNGKASEKNTGVIDYVFRSSPYEYLRITANGAFVSDPDIVWSRSAVHVRPDYYVVFDAVAAKQPSSIAIQWHTGTDGLAASEKDGFVIEKSKSRLNSYLSADSPLSVHISKNQDIVQITSTAAETDRTGVITLFYPEITMPETKPYMTTFIQEAIKNSSGKKSISVTVEKVQGTAYLADTAGDYIEYHIDVTNEGKYEVFGRHITSPAYGTVDVYVNDKKSFSYDGFGSQGLSADLSYGTYFLSKGVHNIKYVITGKNEKSQNMFMGQVYAYLVPVSSDKQKNQRTAVRTPLNIESIRSKEVAGISVTKNNTADTILFSLPSASDSAAAPVSVKSAEKTIDFSGDTTAIRFNRRNQKSSIKTILKTADLISRYALVRGRELRVNGSLLSKSVHPVSAAMYWQGGVLRGNVEIFEKETELKLFLPAITALSINNRDVDGIEKRFHSESGIFTITLTKGCYQISGTYNEK